MKISPASGAVPKAGQTTLADVLRGNKKEDDEAITSRREISTSRELGFNGSGNKPKIHLEFTPWYSGTRRFVGGPGPVGGGLVETVGMDSEKPDRWRRVVKVKLGKKRHRFALNCEETMQKFVAAGVTVLLLGSVPSGFAQQQRAEPFSAEGIPPVPLPDPPVEFDTAEGERIRVSVVTAGLTYPWGFEFLPDGSVLVTERLGTLRVIRDGALEPAPLAGVPEVYTEQALAGLMDVAIHPEFAQNRWVYLTYSKPTENGSAVALARGRLEGAVITEVRDLFVSNGDGAAAGAARLLFAPDGSLFMSLGGAFGGRRAAAQDPASHVGKMLRLNDDGTAHADNPLAGQAGAAEVYSLGHRNQMGVALHPDTGELWASEHAPQGGDEVNIILPGQNYGWPEVSYSGSSPIRVQRLTSQEARQVARRSDRMSRGPLQFQQEQLFIPHAACTSEDRFDGRVDRFDHTEADGMEAVGGDAVEMTTEERPEALHLREPLPAQRFHPADEEVPHAHRRLIGPEAVELFA